MHRRTILLVALAVAGLSLAACGGDDTGDGGSAAAPAAAATSDDDAADGASESEDRTSDGGGLNLLDEDCRFVLGGVGAGVDPSSIFGTGGESDFSAVAAAWQAITDRAPREIRPEMQVFVDALAEMAEVLDGIDLTDPAALADPENRAKLESLDEVLDTERLDQATDAIEKWFEENCAA